MYSANMSYFQLQKYLKYLLKLGLIDKVEIDSPGVTYRVTEKGLDLLKSIEGVLEVLQSNDTSEKPESLLPECISSGTRLPSSAGMPEK
jgi:DNA-binding HxlR family transcriptional regulator